MAFRKALMMMAGMTAWLASPALAHMPYVLPSVFDAGDRPRVTIEAAFTEDAFRPDIAMKDAPFEVTGPDGRTATLAPPSLFTADRTLVEVALPTDGLYRVSSGQRLGRMGKMYRHGDDWTMVGEGSPPPSGVTLVDVRSATLADAYVLRGRPTQPGALTARGKHLELLPLSDPSAFATNTPVVFRVLYDGKPLSGQPVSVFREAGYYDGRKQAASINADAAGRASFTPAQPGRYLMLLRHRDKAASDVGAPYVSYTTTVAFEVM